MEGREYLVSRYVIRNKLRKYGNRGQKWKGTRDYWETLNSGRRSCYGKYADLGHFILLLCRERLRNEQRFITDK